MSITKEYWGKTAEGQDVFLYTLNNGKGITAGILNYGGIITTLKVPDKDGKIEDIVLGYDNLDPYLINPPYFGAIIGRYANRISKGKFSIEGREYTLAQNAFPNHLHGGMKGFDKKVWQAEEIENTAFVGVKLSYLSIDGEEGYPGNVKVTVVFSLNHENELKIAYEAETDKATPLNLTHHSYFNLKGEGNGDILDHQLMIKASGITIVDDQFIPTAEISPVAGTPFDFNHFTAIGARVKNVPGGYDHNFVLQKNRGEYSLVASVVEPSSGRKMDVYTTEPGMQFYIGNFLDSSLIGKKGKAYDKHSGFCLETQHFPDSPNQPSFPDVILQPGEKYTQLTAYKFY